MKRGGSSNNKQIITVNQDELNDLESSHKMLAELSKLKLDNEDICKDKQANIPKPSISSNTENNNNEDDFLKNNQVSANEADEIKDDVIENKHKTGNIVVDKSSNSNKNEEEDFQFDCNLIVFSSKNEIDNLTQELISLLGDRVFKAAYKLVYDNVSEM